MAAITYGTHGATAEKKVSKTSVSKTAAKKPGFWSRIWDGFVEARMRQAEREIRMHRHLLPAEFELAGSRIGSKNEDSLPFVRARD
ncbi:MAG TPA: hypothetical protein VJL90_00645 [Pseudorhodoplanes sp.]|nr:hypothetical protein [Pseudorhodoplanes sp.]